MSPYLISDEMCLAEFYLELKTMPSHQQKTQRLKRSATFNVML